MELRHLRYFVAVAEELHFTRAAERLGIGQPPLSQQIHQLEDELGGLLFHRLSRGVEMTEAGRAFFNDAQNILRGAERAKATVQRIARGEQGQLRIGFTASAAFNMFVPFTIRVFKECYQGISVSLVEYATPPLRDMLHQGLLDVALIRPPYGPRDDLSVEHLFKEEMLIALPADHPLTKEASLPLEALADEVFILYPRHVGPGIFDRIISACQSAGFSPQIGQDAPHLVSTVHLVAAGLGVAIVPASMKHMHADSVQYRPIAGDAPVAPLGVACRRNERSPTVKNFVSTVLRLAEEQFGAKHD